MSVSWERGTATVSAEQRVGTVVPRVVPSAWESLAMLVSMWEGGYSGKGGAKREKERDAKE